jgi:hypothetical protein
MKLFVLFFDCFKYSVTCFCFAFLFSIQSIAASPQKTIALENFWSAFDATHNYSYRAVERYRKNLPPQHPYRIFLSQDKNIKAAQAQIKGDFLIALDKNYKRADLIVLTKIMRDPRYINLLELTAEVSEDKRTTGVLEEFLKKNLSSQ